MRERLGLAMKKLAILLVVVLILGGGAGAGWWFFLREQPEGEEARAAAAEAQSLVPLARVIKLDPIILPVIREGQVTLHITAVVVVELTKPTELENLLQFSAPLRDTMLSELHGVYSIRYVQERGYNIPIVRERLGQAAERVLGEGMVKSVRLQDIIKRVPDTG